MRMNSRRRFLASVLDNEVQKIYPCLWFDLKKAIRDAKEQADNAMVVDN